MVAPDKQLHREFNDSLSHRLVVEQTLLINQPAPFIRMLDSSKGDEVTRSKNRTVYATERNRYSITFPLSSNCWSHRRKNIVEVLTLLAQVDGAKIQRNPALQGRRKQSAYVTAALTISIQPHFKELIKICTMLLGISLHIMCLQLLLALPPSLCHWWKQGVMQLNNDD